MGRLQDLPTEIEFSFVEHMTTDDLIELTTRYREIEAENARLRDALELLKLLDVDEDGVFEIRKNGALLIWAGSAYDIVDALMPLNLQNRAALEPASEQAVGGGGE